MALETQRPIATAGEPGPEPAPDLLTDELVIVARDRAREPELAEATVRAALAARIAPDLARFDLIELPPPAGDDDESRLAAEFARRGHRVFSLRASPPPGDGRDDPVVPAAEPNLIEIAVHLPDPSAAGAGASREAALLDVLAGLRREHQVEAAALLVRDPDWADLVVRARERWGWRVVVERGAGAASPRLDRAADVVIAAGGAESTALSAPGRHSRIRYADLGAGWEAVDQAVRAAFPRASVIVVTYDNLVFNRLCFAGLLANTEYPNYELIVVDNGSTDGTVDDLRELARRYPHVRLVLNDHNRGFGAANNQALAIAGGEVLVLLNNDTIVSRGWLTRLVQHLAEPRLGLVGPATNRIGNEAQVDAPYATYGEFVGFARARSAAHDGERQAIRMPMMFCVAMRRDVYRRVGPLDERFEVAMFEDEDYALRIKAAGYDVAWAPDVYVHHAYHATVGKLLPRGEYLSLFRANQARFEEKWGICWERHRPRP